MRCLIFLLNDLHLTELYNILASNYFIVEKSQGKFKIKHKKGKKLKKPSSEVVFFDDSGYLNIVRELM